MRDILPAEAPAWHYLEQEVRAVLEAYGYQEIRIPILEHTAVFERIGEQTDIVEKEMYTFEDRNGDSLTLRPEGTAGCVRAGIENGLLYNQVQRLWYAGPMFRHERPQKGRYRQFHQIGAETFGMAGPDIDAELVLMSARIWRRLGLGPLRLEINSLGVAETRLAYRQRLFDYFASHQSSLDEDSQRRLHRNPLRILDSKNPAMQDLIAAAPTLAGQLDPASAAHFEALQGLLRSAGLAFHINYCLVRGLDYYNRTVFEWITDRLGAQGTVCAGGRYDALVEQFGGKPTPAAGFAMGLERLVALIDHGSSQPPHAYLIAVDPEGSGDALRLAESLRDQLPDLRLVIHCGGGSFKTQFKRADRSGAKLALVLGPTERAHDRVGVKILDENVEQVTVSAQHLAQYLKETLDKRGISLSADPGPR